MQYSIVVPIYSDGYLAPALCDEIERVMSAYVGATPLHQVLELIFVNDGSKDESLKTLLELRNRYKFVCVIDLSRNFGQHQAIACGIREARGAVVLCMNVDMQDPPAEIPKLLNTMKEGDYDLVVGQYDVRRHPLLVKLNSHIYYSVFRLLTGFEVPQRTSPLRAMNRRFIAAYNRLTEKSRFPQGLDQWLGFRHRYVRIEHRQRIDNRSSYGLWSRTILALNGILYFSDRPLKLMTTFGFASAAIGLAMAVYFIVARLADLSFLPGWFSLAAIGLIAFGVQIVCIGLVGLYIGRIFSEVQNRPLYIIREKFDPVSPEVLNQGQSYGKTA